MIQNKKLIGFILIVSTALNTRGAITLNAQLPIGLADKNAIIEKLPEIQECALRLEQKAQTFGQEMTKLEEAIKKEAEELQTKGSLLSEEKRKDSQEKIEKMTREGRLRYQSGREELEKERMKETAYIDQCAKNAVGKKAEENNLLMVFDSKTGEMLYASSKLPDLTNEVISSTQKKTDVKKDAQTVKPVSATPNK